MAEKRYENTGNELKFLVEDAYAKIISYRDTLGLYETALIPQAKQAFDASQTGFETGKVSFLSWLDIERTYLQTRLAYHKTLADYLKSIAVLERVLGREID